MPYLDIFRLKVKLACKSKNNLTNKYEDKKMLKKLLSAVCVSLMVMGLVACDKQGPAERAGEKMDNAAERAGDKIENATDKAGEKMEDAGDRIEDKTDK